MYKPKVYLSGGFKSNWQKMVMDSISDNCIFFNPREHKLANSTEYWTWDVHFVKECDIIFAFMEVDNPSGFGLAFELGLAYGLNKTIILVDEKSKHHEDFEKYFRIVSHSSIVRFDTLQEGVQFLKTFTEMDDSIR